VILPGIWNQIFESTKLAINGVPISLICDEFQDVVGKSLVAVIAVSSKAKFLLSLEEVPTCNGETIAGIVNAALELFEIAPALVVSFTTDGARYMGTAATRLPGEHVHCISHICHLMAKELMDAMEPLNKLITILTRLLKVGCSKKRINMLKAVVSDAGMRFPRFASYTRWGDWLRFVVGLIPIWGIVSEFMVEEQIQSIERDHMFELFDSEAVREMAQHVDRIAPILNSITLISQAWPHSKNLWLQIESLFAIRTWVSFEGFSPRHF